MNLDRKLTLPAMPLLWDRTNVAVSYKTIAGALAHWAVIQSPYVVPDNLGAAIEQFLAAWTSSDFATMTSADLGIRILATIDECPLIRAWNNPKVGNPVFGFVSRYSKLHPDSDFIDLHALARNVCHELILWAQVEAAQDEVRDAA